MYTMLIILTTVVLTSGYIKMYWLSENVRYINSLTKSINDILEDDLDEEDKLQEIYEYINQ